MNFSETDTKFKSPYDISKAEKLIGNYKESEFNVLKPYEARIYLIK